MNPRQRDGVISLGRHSDYEQFISLIKERRQEQLEALAYTTPDPLLIGNKQGYIQALNMIIGLVDEAAQARNAAREDN